MTHSRKKLVVAMAMIGATYASAVYAADDDTASVERVEVTGSNIKRLKNEGALPVTSIATSDLTKQGMTTVQDVIQTMALSTSAVTANNSIGSDSGGASFADLRGLGSQYTLVLLDGRRIANQAGDGRSVDLNAIPLSIIDRVDVLRDGASAIYGTDAIGGVINFITKKSFKGVQLEANGLLPKETGGRQGEVSITGGYGDLANDGWNAYGTLSYQKTQELMTTDRDFATAALLPNGSSGSTWPANFKYKGSTYNSLAPNCNNGSPYLIPNQNDPNSCREQTPLFTQIQPKVEQITAAAKLSKQVGDDHLLALQYAGTRTKTDTIVAPTPISINTDGVTVNSSSPFYPKTLPDGTATDGTAVTLGGRSVPAGGRMDESINTTQRLLGTAEGVVGPWNYHAGLGYSQSEYTHDLTGGYISKTLLQEALNAGLIDPFSSSTAGWDQVGLRGRIEDDKYTVATADVNVSRDNLIALPAGGLAVSFGAEARHEKLTADFTSLTVDAMSSGLDHSVDTTGSRNVQALTAEASFPIIKGLDGDIALRDDHYSDVGNAFNPKFSLRFQPTKEVVFRGAASTGFRAPSLYNLYQPENYTNTAGQYDDPVLCATGKPTNGGSSSDCGQQFQKQLGGTTNLQSEKSSTLTFGFLLQPTPSLLFSADFYWTHIDHAIGNLSETVIFENPDKYASRYVRKADGTLDYVIDKTQNLGKVNTSGVDISTSYQFPKSSLGNFSVSLDGTYVTKFDYQYEEGGDYAHGVGLYADYNNAPIFRWKHYAALKWNNGPFSAILGSSFESSYHDKYGGDVPTYTLFNLSGSYVWQKSLTLTAGLRNLFDKQPPYSNQDDTFQAGYDPRYTDSLGRTLYLQASYKM